MQKTITQHLCLRTLLLLLAATHLCHVQGQDEDGYDEDEDVEDFRNSLTWGRIFLDSGVGHHQYFKARFGGDIPMGKLPIVVADPVLACAPIKNGDKIKNALVVVQRGECTYATKARNLQKTGAKGILVQNNADEGLTHPPGPDGTDITIAVAMITHDFGNMLRAMGERGHSTNAQMLPIYCEKESGVSVCLPVTEEEKAVHSVTEGGSIVTANGFKAEFLTAKFGSPIPMASEATLVAAEPANCCSELDKSKVDGKALLLRRGGCTFLDKVSNAQRAGASAAIIVNTQPGILRMDSLKKYESYNITIPTVMMATEKGDELQDKLGAGEVKITFKDTGLKASVWDNLRNEVAAEQWPLEPEEAKEMYLSLLKQHVDSDERKLYLQDAFRDTGIEAEEYLEANQELG